MYRIFYQLYVLIDICSRFNPSWIISPVEDSLLAKDFVADAIERNGVTPHTVHADSKTESCRGSRVNNDCEYESVAFGRV